MQTNLILTWFWKKLKKKSFRFENYFEYFFWFRKILCESFFQKIYYFFVVARFDYLEKIFKFRNGKIPISKNILIVLTSVNSKYNILRIAERTITKRKKEEGRKV